MELLLPQSRWPEANCASCFQNNPCLYIHSLPTHTLNNNNKNPAGTKQKQAHAKKSDLWRMYLSPRWSRFLSSLCAQLNGQYLALILLDFPKHLYYFFWKLPHLVTATTCSPGSLGIFLASPSPSWVPLSLPSPVTPRRFPRMPPPCPALSLVYRLLLESE